MQEQNLRLLIDTLNQLLLASGNSECYFTGVTAIMDIEPESQACVHTKPHKEAEMNHA